jgi:hypothetical protein
VSSGTKLNNGVLFVNNGGIVYQRVSGVAGKTVTFAMKTNGTGEQHMSVYTADLGKMMQQIWGYKNSDGIVCGTATIPSDIDVAAFILYPENGSIIEWVALYEGEYTADTLPPYVSKGYAAELAECQRYFVRFNAERDTGYSIFCWGLAEGESVFYPQLAVPITMRKGVVASIAHSSGCRCYYLNASGGASVSDIVNIESKSGVATGSITLTVTVSGAPFTKGLHAAIQLPAGGYIDISKDL